MRAARWQGFVEAQVATRGQFHDTPASQRDWCHMRHRGWCSGRHSTGGAPERVRHWRPHNPVVPRGACCGGRVVEMAAGTAGDAVSVRQCRMLCTVGAVDEVAIGLVGIVCPYCVPACC